ncbi:hypothetical protein KC727_03475 [Candidatus Kaiserbacteria bacterium]|nr:hypothetical protein [Candidatus Kaiserbacteria bacterium]
MRKKATSVPNRGTVHLEFDHFSSGMANMPYGGIEDCLRRMHLLRKDQFMSVDRSWEGTVVRFTPKSLSSETATVLLLGFWGFPEHVLWPKKVGEPAYLFFRSCTLNRSGVDGILTRHDLPNHEWGLGVDVKNIPTHVHFCPNERFSVGDTECLKKVIPGVISIFLEGGEVGTEPTNTEQKLRSARATH